MNLERAVIEINGGCNYSCEMCPQTNPGRHKGFLKVMKLDMFEDIVKQCAERGVKIINLEGSGEATLVRKLPEYIKIVRKYGARADICSNGFRFKGQYMKDCIDAGLNFEGINQEVASGQWEFQLFAKGAKQAGDEIWIARYLLDRLTEAYGYYIEYHPKPVKGDWNGSGMHANFSNTILRTCGDKEVYAKICEAFRPVVKEHIEVYGEFNDQRLTGLHETAAITDFSWGISDRGASIRIPIIAVEKGWKGWLEDRRPASNGDPYKIAGRIIKTVKSAKI